MRLKFLVLFLSGLSLAATQVANSQGAGPDSGLTSSKIVLTPAEIAEREGRKACKVALCDALHNRTPGTDVSCAIVKSFRKTQLDKLLARAKASWPWGPVVCKANVKAKRDLLMNALVADKLEADFGLHAAACTVERDGAEPAVISFEMTPKITFEKGKAVKAVLNWGKVDGPKVIKGIMWTATATDNTLNVLGSMVVDDVNSFTGAKCTEVKSDWEKN